jgi:siroheme synthase
MGIGGLDEICRQLMAHGLPGSTPAAVVRNATLDDQRVVQAQVATLAIACHTAAIKPPALIVIGSVASLTTRMDWFSVARRAAGPQGLSLVRSGNS